MFARRSVFLAIGALLLAAVVFSVDGPRRTTEATPASPFIHVAPWGADTNSGAEDAPLYHIQAGVDRARAGQTLLVHAGEYAERVIVEKSGRSEAPLRIEAVEGARVVVSGFTLGPTAPVRFVRISGFEITSLPKTESPGGAGIAINGSDCEILGNRIHDVMSHGIAPFGYPNDHRRNTVRRNKIAKFRGSGVKVDGQDWLVERNNISRGTVLLGETPVTDDTDAFRFGGRGHVFRRNTVHDFRFSDNVHEPAPHMDAWQAFTAAENITIEENTVRDFDGQWMMLNGNYQGDISDITVRNNVFVSNAEGMYGVNMRGVTGAVVTNNTFANDGYYAVHLADGTEATLRNNIFYREASVFTDGPYLVDDSSTIDADYDLVSPVAAETAPLSWNEAHGRWGVDPRFVDPGDADFRLAPGSPARDSADGDAAPQTDGDGQPRVDDGDVYDSGTGTPPFADIGALEAME